MHNSRIKTEADLLVLTARLPQLLAPYPEWFIGGSYSYDLMCWRDLDVYVLDQKQDLEQCFAIACQITKRLAALKSRFTNNSGGEPNGLYWGIKLGNVREGAWKLDLWFLDQQGYDSHSEYISRMKQKLSPETTAAILAIKEAYWQRPEFRVTVTSDMIYRAVLDHGVRDVAGFDRFLLNHST